MKILSINPGGLSTKIGLYENTDPIFVMDIQHTEEELKDLIDVTEQFKFRKNVIIEKLKEKSVNIREIEAFVGRGGLFKPLKAGAYEVNELMVNDVLNGNVFGDHPSNLGCLIAYSLAKDAGGKKAFIVDPISIDEFIEEARISGFPGIKRRSLVHALNVRATSFKLAKKLGKSFYELNLVVCHLGSGYTIAAIRKGKIIDVNNANDGGPFSPQRSGSIPVTQLVDVAFSGKYKNAKELKRVITKKSGVYGYLGTYNLIEVEERISNGDDYAKLIINAMVYQIAKEVGAMSAVLDGNVDGIILTGGVAKSNYVVGKLKKKISWIAPIHHFPGENELESLAMGAYRVLSGEEKPHIYE